MTKAKMDYLWAPKSEGIVSNILDQLGVARVGESNRYPTGVKYDALVAISDVIHNHEDFASMVASALHGYQAKRKLVSPAESFIKLASTMSEVELKQAMKQAGLLD